MFMCERIFRTQIEQLGDARKISTLNKFGQIVECMRQTLRAIRWAMMKNVPSGSVQILCNEM